MKLSKNKKQRSRADPQPHCTAEDIKNNQETGGVAIRRIKKTKYKWPQRRMSNNNIFFKKALSGPLGGLEDKGMCSHAWQTEFNSWKPRDGKREQTPKSYPLTFTLTLWYAHMCMCTHAQNIALWIGMPSVTLVSDTFLSAVSATSPEILDPLWSSLWVSHKLPEKDSKFV